MNTENAFIVTGCETIETLMGIALLACVVACYFIAACFITSFFDKKEKSEVSEMSTDKLSTEIEKINYYRELIAKEQAEIDEVLEELKKYTSKGGKSE